MSAIASMISSLVTQPLPRCARVFALLVCIFALLVVPQNALSQDDPPNFDDAVKLYKDGNFQAANTMLTQLVQADPKNKQYNYYCGMSQLQGTSDRTQAWRYLENARDMEDAPDTYFFELGRAYHLGYKFSQAIGAYQRFLGTTSNEELSAKATKALEDCFTASELVKFPVDVEIQNLGEDVNSEAADYTPFVDREESILIFTSRRKRGNQSEEPEKDGHYTSDIYISAIDNGRWKKPKNMGKTINSEVDEEAIGMATDGSLMFMNIGGRGVAGQMVVSHRSSKTNFKEPIEVENTINSSAEERTSSVSLDLQTFFFASNRKDGSGGFDLYMTKRLPTQDWGTAVNLGPLVNTPGDELFPQLSPDEKTLFFVSNGHSGMGGFDIFRCQWLEEENQWGAPENMGYPINTPDDEMNFTLCATGKTGYLSGLRPGGQGDLDLYSVTFGEVEYRNTLVVGQVQTEVPVDYNRYEEFDVYKKEEAVIKCPAGFTPPSDWKLVEHKRIVARPRFTYQYNLVFERNGKREEFTPEQLKGVTSEHTFVTCKQVQATTDNFIPPKDRLESVTRPVGDAFINVYDRNTDDLVGSYIPVPGTGRYCMILPPGQYLLEAEADGYSFFTEEFDILGKGSFSVKLEKDILLESESKPKPIHFSEIQTEEE